MTEQAQVVCKDCKHSFRHWTDVVMFYYHEISYRCRRALREQTTEFSPVVGTEVIAKKYESCYAMRSRGRECGPEAKMWEPSSKDMLFTYIKHISKDD